MHPFIGYLMQTPVPGSLDEAVDALTTLGVLPVIALAATIAMAALVYKRFRH